MPAWAGVAAIIGPNGQVSLELYWQGIIDNNDDFYIFFADSTFERCFGFFCETVNNINSLFAGSQWLGWCQIRDDGVIPAQFGLANEAASLPYGAFTPVTIVRTGTILTATVGAGIPLVLDTGTFVNYQIGIGYSTAISSSDIRVRNINIT